MRSIKAENAFRNHLLIALLAILSVGFLHYALHARTAREILEIRANSKLEQFSKLKMVFEGETFVSLSDALVDRASSGMVVTGALISAQQGFALRSTVKDTLSYLKQPKYEAFLAYNAGSTLSSNKLQSGLALFAAIGQDEPLDLASKDYSRQLWELMTADRIDGGICKLVSIWDKPIQCKISNLASTNGHSLTRALGKLLFVETAMRSVFEPAESSQETLKREGVNTFADIYFLARASSSSKGGPFFLSYYWSPKVQKWVLNGIHSDPDLLFRTML